MEAAVDQEIKTFNQSLFDKEKIIGWDDLCFVRGVENPGREFKNENGNLVSQTPIDNSKGEIPRITSHWTLNHFVEPHFGGSWESCEAILICPGEKMIQTNGKPENLNLVDTFWAHNIVIPDESVILWINKPPENIQISDNISQVYVDYPYDKKKEMDETNKKIENKEFDSVEELDALFKKWGNLKHELQKCISDSVDEQIIKMKYNILDGNFCNDHHHLPAIDNLAEKEGIKFTGHHIDSSLGNLELGEGTGYANPLLDLGTLSNNELFKYDERGKSKFKYLLDNIRETLVDFKEPLSPGEEKQLNILSAEIYNKLINVKGVFDNFDDELAVSFLCNKSKFIKNNFKKWVKKDTGENAEKLKIILSGYLV